MQSLDTLSLRDIAAGVRERRSSAADVMRDHAKRITATEPKVQAWEHLDLDRAMSAAEASDGGGMRGLLQGVPIAIKDIIDVAGMPTRYGSPIYESAPPAAETAESVEALERAGAIVTGKSVTTEFAYYTPGKTRNPWNASHTPGGSSMGSAAAVACGMAAGALGTQTNGSVIRPAAYCGIVGFKPSFGTVSNHGTLDPWPSLDHTGVFARNVADAAVLASVIARPAHLSHTPAPAAVPLPSHALRIGVVRSPVWHLAEAPQRELLEASAAKLGHAGARVDDLDLPREFRDAHRVHRVILAYEGARHFRELQDRHRALISARFNDLLDEGRATSARDYGHAIQAAGALRASFACVIEGYDALVTPPAAGEAPATLEETGNPAFCTIWTLLGVPAITVPIALGPAGLPLGLQLVGPYLHDDALLGVAAWLESHLTGRTPVSPLG